MTFSSDGASLEPLGVSCWRGGDPLKSEELDYSKGEIQKLSPGPETTDQGVKPVSQLPGAPPLPRPQGPVVFLYRPPTKSGRTLRALIEINTKIYGARQWSLTPTQLSGSEGPVSQMRTHIPLARQPKAPAGLVLPRALAKAGSSGPSVLLNADDAGE